MTLITTLEGFVLSIPAFFSNAFQAFTTFIQKTTGISPADLHHILRWTGIFLFAFLLFIIYGFLVILPAAMVLAVCRNILLLSVVFVCRLREILMFFAFRPGAMPIRIRHVIRDVRAIKSIGKTAVL